MNTRIVYYVEGETEETFIGSLKGEMTLILPGRIRVFNVVNKPLSNFIRRGFSQNEIAVFVFVALSYLPCLVYLVVCLGIGADGREAQ